MNSKDAARRRWEKRGKRRNETKERMHALEDENSALKARVQDLEAQLQESRDHLLPWGGFGNIWSPYSGGPFSARSGTASGRFA